MISILVVDDSATARAALRQVIESDPQLMVVGEAESGDEALQAIERKRPNLVTMDVFLRRENGLDITEAIMARCPTPILIVTGGNVSDPALVFRAMEVGALDVCSKLPSPRSPNYPPARDRFVRLVKTLSQVPVVHRKPRRMRTTDHQIHRPTTPSSAPRLANPGVLVIGASTGGPPVLGAILGQLPRPFPLPIAVAQHMAEGFVRGFADWLADETTLPVVCVEEAVSLT
ncbi:MAG: response regulator, partial [bacterium]|nr:response regulator [bacterium]